MKFPIETILHVGFICVMFFIVLAFLTFFGQLIMNLPETGKESLILFSAQRTYRSFDKLTDVIMTMTRLVSVVLSFETVLSCNLLQIDTEGGKLLSFRIWNCSLIFIYFFLSAVNSLIGLLTTKGNKCCLTSSKSTGYYFYASFLQIIFVISGSSSFFIATGTYWFIDKSLDIWSIKLSILPAVYMSIEMILSKYYVRFNNYWMAIIYLFIYISTMWYCSQDIQDSFPYHDLFSLSNGDSITLHRNYLVAIFLNYLMFGIWYFFSELKVELHNRFDVRKYSSFLDPSSALSPSSYGSIAMTESINI